MFQQFDFRVLADLNLDYLDISAVQPESLAMVLINLRRVSLKKCSLAAAQTQLIFETIARNEPADIKLRSANFYGNNLKEAAAEHLTAAMVRRRTSVYFYQRFYQILLMLPPSIC